MRGFRSKWLRPTVHRVTAQLIVCFPPMKHALELRAGPMAHRILVDQGFDAANVDTVVGASGGPKWQILAGLDRVLFRMLHDAARDAPLNLLGSSVGSWRMACLAQEDPVTAISRFEEIYLQQRYSPQPTTDEITGMAEGLLDALLGEDGITQILDSWARLHVITARCKGLLASENRKLQVAGLSMAAVANAVSRRSLGLFAERVIFAADASMNPFLHLDDLPTRHGVLTQENLRDALLGSAAIPLVFNGRHVAGVPGMHRDGGLLDYHPAFDFGGAYDNSLVLYPHFYNEIIPGWFDKKLSRRGGGKKFDRVLLLAPSREFVASLPGGRVPDRKDFHRYGDVERERIWRGVMDASRRLGDEFADLVATGNWGERLLPFASRDARFRETG